tara:strand:+ start:3641 stop:3787 length:147 start_codon:yes stop_codon:yes gene_type:complete
MPFLFLLVYVAILVKQPIADYYPYEQFLLLTLREIMRSLKRNEHYPNG